MGGVWLFGLTNENGGPQIGRIIMYHAFSAVETATCSYIWVYMMKDSGEFFEIKVR